MNNFAEVAAGQALDALVSLAGDREAAMEQIYAHLKDSGLLPKVTMHRYMCKRGCQIATAFSAGGLILCAVSDYKLSPGLNWELSVEEARKRNTLDGEKHWPGHVHDVMQLNRFSTADNQAAMDMNCRHRRGPILAVDILSVCQGITPGKPGAPTLL